MFFKYENNCTLSLGIDQEKFNLLDLNNQTKEITYTTTNIKSIIWNKEVLVNLDENYIKYFFLKSHYKKSKDIKVEILERLKVYTEDVPSYDFFSKKINKNLYLIFYFEKEKIQEVLEILGKKNAIIYPEILGGYNYLKFLNKDKKLKNSIIVQMKKKKTIILFIKNKKLSDIKEVQLGLNHFQEKTKNLSFSNEESNLKKQEVISLKAITLKWMREIKHTISKDIDNSTKYDKIYLLGYENIIENLENIFEGYLGISIGKIDESPDFFSYINNLGNLLAHRKETLRLKKEKKKFIFWNWKRRPSNKYNLKEA